MGRHPVVAILLALTALVVLVPAVVQVARKELRPREAWPHLLVAFGMLAVAAANGLLVDGQQAWLAGAGFIAALAGMLALQRRR